MRNKLAWSWNALPDFEPPRNCRDYTESLTGYSSAPSWQERGGLRLNPSQLY